MRSQPLDQIGLVEWANAFAHKGHQQRQLLANMQFGGKKQGSLRFFIDQFDAHAKKSQTCRTAQAAAHENTKFVARNRVVIAEGEVKDRQPMV